MSMWEKENFFLLGLSKPYILGKGEEPEPLIMVYFSIWRPYKRGMGVLSMPWGSVDTLPLRVKGMVYEEVCVCRGR